MSLVERYLQMSEILSTGKILYKTTDPAKLSDYTFTDLLKKVRQEAKVKEPVAKALVTSPNI